MERITRFLAVARDTKRPKTLRVLCGLAVIYILFPFDFLPDLMPVLGWIDDLLVFIWLISQVKNLRNLNVDKQKLPLGTQALD